MPPIKNIPDLFNAYDHIFRLSKDLFEVQSGEKKGVFSETTMELVLPIAYDRIDFLGGNQIRVWMDDAYDDILLNENGQLPNCPT